jgi:SAM-dependent methyltransferase
VLPGLPLNAWLRYDCIARSIASLPDIDSILEIGTGKGAVGARLARRYEYVGLEPDPESYAIARANIEPAGGKVICGDVTALEPGETFALVGAFEVIEHIEDDAGTLRLWREHVRPGGWVMLSAPPFQSRFGPHDRTVGHFRRYDPEQMAKLLTDAGFSDPQILLYGFPLGYALEAARHGLARISGPVGNTMAEQTAASGRRRQPPTWLAPITEGVTLPFRVLQRPFLRTRLGTGLFAVAQRRDR